MPDAIAQGFETLLGRLELTQDQQAKLSTSQEYLRSILAGKFTLERTPTLIGSYARHTQIRQDRDIDLLLVLADDPHWKQYEKRSGALVRDLRRAIKSTYPKTKSNDAGVAVVMDMEVVNFDVVPAFLSADHFVIPDGDDSWQTTNPIHHIELMEARGKKDSRLKPLVKVMKFWNLRRGSWLQSLHLEMAIERIWRGRLIPDYPGGVASTLSYLRSLLNYPPFHDPWSAEKRLDGYLWVLPRHWAKDAVGSAAEVTIRAEGLRLAGREDEAIAAWQTVFAGDFPVG